MHIEQKPYIELHNLPSDNLQLPYFLEFLVEFGIAFVRTVDLLLAQEKRDLPRPLRQLPPQFWRPPLILQLQAVQLQAVVLGCYISLGLIAL
jgi:hypothetical protein